MGVGENTTYFQRLECSMTVVPEEKETREMTVLVVRLEACSTAHYGKSKTKKTIVASLIVTIEVWS